jgi:hypothetical protein
MSRDKYYYDNLIGKKFNFLTITKFLGFFLQGKEHKRAKFLCTCECGNQKEAFLPHIKNGNVKSCGCRKIGKYNKAWKGSGKIGMTLWNRFIRNASDRNIEFNITIGYANKLFDKQRGKCALSGVDIQLSYDQKTCTASLDRKDSYKGYIKGNVQWLHKDVNIMKRCITDKQFIEFCHKVAKFRPLIK